jgi:hypothetical protein
VRSVDLLRHLADDRGTGRIGQPGQLAQVFVERPPGARPFQRRANEERAVSRRRDVDQFACDAPLLSEWWRSPW